MSHMEVRYIERDGSRTTEFYPSNCEKIIRDDVRCIYIGIYPDYEGEDLFFNIKLLDTPTPRKWNICSWFKLMWLRMKSWL